MTGWGEALLYSSPREGDLERGEFLGDCLGDGRGEFRGEGVNLLTDGCNA